MTSVRPGHCTCMPNFKHPRGTPSASQHDITCVATPESWTLPLARTIPPLVRPVSSFLPQQSPASTSSLPIVYRPHRGSAQTSACRSPSVHQSFDPRCYTGRRLHEQTRSQHVPQFVRKGKEADPYFLLSSYEITGQEVAGVRLDRDET